MAIARSVAIIGGGIGVLTVANSLKRLGLSVSLYQRSPLFYFNCRRKISLAYISFRDEAEKLLHPFYRWQIINDNGEI